MKMINASWSITENSVVRIPATRISVEQRIAIAAKVTDRFPLPLLKTCILCDQCFQGEVAEEGRKCAKCVVILERRQERALQTEQIEMCKRILLYGLVVGGLLIWISSVLSKN